MCMRKMSLPRCDERKDKKKILHHWFGSEWNVSVWSIFEIDQGRHIGRYWEYDEIFVWSTIFVEQIPLLLVLLYLYRHKILIFFKIFNSIFFNSIFSSRRFSFSVDTGHFLLSLPAFRGCGRSMRVNGDYVGDSIFLFLDWYK